MTDYDVTKLPDSTLEHIMMDEKAPTGRRLEAAAELRRRREAQS